MANSSIPQRYYPRLSELITVDDLPDFLSFVQGSLNDLLDNVHYKNLQSSKSYRGDAAFYSLDIVTNNIGIDLPFGMRFVLNPDIAGDSSISSFPVSLQYQWGIIAFLRSFDLQNFSFSPDGFFQLGLQIFKITDVQVIVQILNFFVKPVDNTVTIYQQLIDDINVLYPSANLAIPAGQTPSATLLATLITQNPNIPSSISELMFAAYILVSDLTTTGQNLQQFYNLIVPGGIETYIQNLIKPSAKVSMTLAAGLEFPTSILQPVDVNGNVVPNTKSIFVFNGATLYIDTQGDIGFNAALTGSLTPMYSQIGNTGIIIGFTNAKLDLSQTTNIPEATAAGYSVDFVGIYVQSATVKLNNLGTEDTTKESVTITATNLLIGTGGVSGTVAFADTGVLYRNFGDFSAELDTFSLTFRQNAITACTISGKITLNKFTLADGVTPATILINAAIKDNGDFSITAKPQTGTFPIALPEVFELDVRTLTIGKDTRGYYVQVSGTLNFTDNSFGLGDVLPKGIEISKLIIWDDGHFEFGGGSITVPVAFSLDVGPVTMEVTKLSIGTYSRMLNGVSRSYSFFGFDGGIDIGSAFDASGNGIKYYFTTDNGPGRPHDSFIRVDGIEIDITVPANVPPDQATFILNGYLSVTNPTSSTSTAATQYTGAVKFTMPKLGLGGSAAMRLTPSIPAFVVDIDMEMSVPIPLGATSLGIYGFRGLLGEHYVPAKSAVTPPLPDTATWWDYYKAPSAITKHEGIEIDKFANEQGFSVGAGMSIATVYDSGFTFSSKLFLLLGLPEVFLIQGQAAILSSRVGLTTASDPPFSALIVISSQSIEGDLGVDYKLPASGGFKSDIVALKANLDMAFFFNNASGWYINIGKNTPASARVQAQILKLFQGYALIFRGC